MRACRFVLYTLDPVLAAQAQSDEPNSAKTYPFIPGSMIRGALIARAGNGAVLNARDEGVRQKFFDGTVCYLNAYPTRGSEYERMLPKPLSWFVPKDRADSKDEPIFDGALKDLEFDERKEPTGSFFWTSAEEANTQLHSPRIQLTVHNASWQRNFKNENASDVYRYEALGVNQFFAGAFITADEHKVMLGEIAALLNAGDLFLGGSHTAGYGRVRVVKSEIVEDWRESQADPLFSKEEEDEHESSNTVTLTCLSDVLVRNAGGQADEALAELLGIPRDEIVETFAEMRLVGGFNRTVGLPLPQAWAITMGSVFVLPSQYRERLQKYVEQGVGERRAEGYGRIALELQRRPQRAQSAWSESTIQAERQKLSELSRTLATRMATRRLESELDEALLKKIETATGRRNATNFKSLPRPAQLARARLAARDAWEKAMQAAHETEPLEQSAKQVTSETQILDVILHHFNNLSDLAKRDWSEARIGQERFVAWIERQLKERQQFRLDVNPIQLGDITVTLGERQRDIYLARFIEGVLKRAQQVAKGPQEEGN